MTTLRPIDSFRQYFLDVKPYHTKILEVVEKYNFREDLPVNIEESIFFNIEYKNDPLCKTVGYGFIWDSDCGFDAVDCCDLFDCIGGYGLIFDNSDLVVSVPINSMNADVDTVVVPGNHLYDVKTQINSIPTYDTIIVNGDLTPYFAYHKLFAILPVRTLNVVENTAGSIKVKGNYAAELVNERKFKLYNTSENDGVYNVIQASYDSVLNTTTIVLATAQQIKPNLSNGIIEYSVGSKNNGAYLVDSHVFDGTSTTITLNSTTTMSFTNTTEGNNHGSIQLRTGMVPGRYIELDTGTDSDGVYKILQSTYSGQSNETTIHLASDILDDALSGWIRMYGYVNDGGFDGDGECSTPKHSNIKVGISERLVIQVFAPECGCYEPTDVLAALNAYPAIPVPPTYTVPFIFTIDALDSVDVVLPLGQQLGGAYDARPVHYDFEVDWGDGNTDTITSWNQAEKAHRYTTSGVKTISITGLFEGINFGSAGAATASKVLEIQQWGVTGLRSLAGAFDGCVQMTFTASDTPDLSLVTGQWACGSAFRDCTFTSGLENWDTSAIRDMESMFEDSACSSDLSGWDVSNVREMLAMFQRATFNNNSLANWDVSQVEDMTAMFNNSSFAGDVSGWRPSRCVSMDNLFDRCYTFNSDVSLWDVSSAQTMSAMFRETAVNGDFSQWNVGDCYNFNSMFSGCTSFNSDISGWDVSNGENFSSMFSGATLFNQNLSGWNIRLAKFMSSMFTGCALSTTNYDLILNAWSQLYPKKSVTLTTDAQYTILTSQDARDILTSAPWTWTINDGGGI